MFQHSVKLVGLWIWSVAIAAPDVAISDASPQQQCQRECTAQKNEFVARCLEEGGSQRECEIAGQRFFEECSHRCLPATICRRQCEKRAKRLYRECQDHGGTEEACAQTAREFLAKCIDENCAPPCDERCAVQARQGYNQCVDEGGSEDDCQVRAQNFLRKCTAHCAECEEKCTVVGREAFRRCIEEGGTQEECAAYGRYVAADCIEANCEWDCGGIVGIPCPEYQFCIFPPGECDVADNLGRCRVMGGGCPLVYDPVCGCDGQTHGNACQAAAEGVSVDHPGPCEEVCGGITGVPCPDGQFCQFPPGECNVADNQGRCRTTPEACPTVYQPVCGCDGKTYGNGCEAAMAGVAIDHEGACAE